MIAKALASGRPIVIAHALVGEGAPQDEQDGLHEAEGVEEALRELGFPCLRLPVTLDLIQARHTLQEHNPLCVFNLVESLEGSGRLIHLFPDLLEHLRVPFTGATAETQYVTSNKPLSKTLLRAGSVPTPPWLPLAALGESGCIHFDFPCIVKSAWEHASVGLGPDSLCRTPQELLRKAGAIGRNRLRSWFAEAFIDGREFNLSILPGPEGAEILPCAEIRFEGFGRDRPKIVDYKAKWEIGSFEYENTPRSFEFAESDSPLLARLREIALDCWRLFGGRGYARVDFRVDGRGVPFVLEYNANPCISDDGGFMAAAARRGLGISDTVARILEETLAEIYA